MSKMQTKVFHTPSFRYEGRGPDLVHWIYDYQLSLPVSPSTGLGSIMGVYYGYEMALKWLIFHGLQVIQIVPEEVHSKWHRQYLERKTDLSCLWEIENSDWLASFSPRHLKNAGYKHYVLVFYDYLVEVICKELVFGEGEFNIEVAAATYPQLNYAYIRYADEQLDLGNREEAARYYQKSLESDPQGESAEYAQACLDAMRAGTL